MSALGSRSGTAGGVWELYNKADGQNHQHSEVQFPVDPPVEGLFGLARGSIMGADQFITCVLRVFNPGVKSLVVRAFNVLRGHFRQKLDFACKVTLRGRFKT